MAGAEFCSACRAGPDWEQWPRSAMPACRLGATPAAAVDSGLRRTCRKLLRRGCPTSARLKAPAKLCVVTQTQTGFAVVDKPQGMTSHDVVARMRKLAGTRKVGHGGTLDPMATGVLVLAIGNVTRLLRYVTGCDKAYTATIRLGETTTTDDAEGELLESADVEEVTQAHVEAALQRQRGAIDQVPSSVSAVKIDGKRSYKRVRDGEAVVLEPRRVTVSALEAVAMRRGDHLEVDVQVECSAGTYIRAIARDLGAALGVGGHLTALRRARVGGFGVDEARSLDALADQPAAVTHSVAATVQRLMPCREVDAADAGKFGNGGKLPATGDAGPYAIVAPNADVIGVAVERDGVCRPDMVLAAGSRR